MNKAELLYDASKFRDPPGDKEKHGSDPVKSDSYESERQEREVKLKLDIPSLGSDMMCCRCLSMGSRLSDGQEGEHSGWCRRFTGNLSLWHFSKWPNRASDRLSVPHLGLTFVAPYLTMLGCEDLQSCPPPER